MAGEYAISPHGGSCSLSAWASARLNGASKAVDRTGACRRVLVGHRVLTQYPGHRGTATLRTLLLDARRSLRSPVEAEFLEFLDAHKLPRPETNVFIEGYEARAPILTHHVISTNQFKNGNHIDVEGTVFKILEFQHVKPGKGGAFVRTKLRRASDGAVIDRTFRAGEKFRPVRTEVRRMQFLYKDGTDAHFMDSGSFEQLAVPEATVQDALRWTKPNDEVDLLFIDGQPSDLQLPSSVELEVTQTEPGVRGDTASGGGNKPATLETGATIQVPLFVNIGDRVKVQTATGEYMSRA